MTVVENRFFELQIALRNMPCEEAFRIQLPIEMSDLSLHELFNEVFSQDSTTQDSFFRTLDIEFNPDLPQIYEELLGVFAKWRTGDCNLTICSKDGAKINRHDISKGHLEYHRASRDQHVAQTVLNLTIQQTFDVFARYVDWHDGTVPLIKWLQQRTFLYFMDKHQFRLSICPENKLDRNLLVIANDLEYLGLISKSKNLRVYEFTTLGENTVQQMVLETESYIERFDIFGDTLLNHYGHIQFNTGTGEDLRVQVYQCEGLDPVKTVFLLLLYDCTLDTYSDTWRERIIQNDFFNQLLQPVLDHSEVSHDAIGLVIEDGYAYNEEALEQQEESAFKEDIWRRLSSN